MSFQVFCKNRIQKVSENKGRRILNPSDSQIKGSTNHLNPAFCFQYIQEGFTIEDCVDDKIKAIIATKMQHLSQISWEEIQKLPRQKAGHEKISQNSLKVSIPNNTPPDREFLSFRLGGGKNSVFIGYRKDQVFYVVWIDPNGKVYNHE